MSMIQYRDGLGKLISESQSQQLENYIKEYLVDGELMNYEVFDNNPHYAGGGVYLHSGESLEDAVSEIVTPIGSWTFYHNKQTNVFGHTSWDKNVYAKGVLVAKSKICYDEEKRRLCNMDVDMNTGEIKLARKMYYNDNYEKAAHNLSAIKFRYSGGNPIITIFILDYDEDERYTPVEFQQLDDIMEILPWHENSYYHDVFPILPNHAIN